jgi:hypothetical protein
MAVNKTSRRVWKYETTPRTSALQNAADVPYFFGEYGDEVQKWQMGAMENKVLDYYINAKATPELADGKRKFNTFHEIFNPTTVQWLVWILGKTTEDGSAAGIHTIEPLDTGYQYPLTIRHEEGGGTETFEQMVSSWCVSAYFRAAITSPFLVDLEFAYEQYQDHDDEPQLTSTILDAGHADTTTAFNGAPTVTYDPDGTPDVVDWITKVEGKINCNYDTTLNGAETAQTVYKREFEPIDFTIQGVSNENTFWDHYMDRDVQDWEIKIFKPAVANYLKMKMVDCIPIKIVKEGEAFKGFYVSTIHLRAEECTGIFTTENDANYDTHYYGEVT